MGKDIPLTVGIDEAGRGPIIGDMILAIVAFDKNRLDLLKSFGVKDSKQLTPHERSILASKIIEISRLTIVTYISPAQIDHYNINDILLETICMILEKASLFLNPYNVCRIVVDMIKGYKRFMPRLKKLFPDAEIVFEEDADAKYIEVSAASIIAKYYRDSDVYGLKELYGDYGSGYPTDPRTISWIKEMYRSGINPPGIVRRTWKTLKTTAPTWFMEKKSMIRASGQKSLLEYLK